MAAKGDLARAGTMQMTSKDGKSYLDRNVTEWKKEYLMDHFEDNSEEGKGASSSKPKLAKHTTMKGTAKEAETLLGGEKPDADALTRGQQKQIEKINAEKPSPKKPKVAKHSTMVNTAKEAKGLLGGEKLADTRAETKTKQAKRGSLKRASTGAQAKNEAEAVYGELDLSGGRKLRKRSAPSPAKPAVKRAGTMQKTAKEGKAFVKRSKKSK